MDKHNVPSENKTLIGMMYKPWDHGIPWSDILLLMEFEISSIQYDHWDQIIILGINYFRWNIHIALWETNTPLKRNEMHKVEYLPKIDIHLGHHHQDCLEKGFARNISLFPL